MQVRDRLVRANRATEDRRTAKAKLEKLAEAQKMSIAKLESMRSKEERGNVLPAG